MSIDRVPSQTTITRKGLAPTLSGNTTDFLNGNGGFSVPPGTGQPSPWPTVTAPPLASAFAATNGGSSTLTDVGDKLVFDTPANASADSIHVWTQAQPSTPYTVTAMVLPTMSQITGFVNTFLGILFRESGTGKIVTMNVEASSTATPFGFDVMKWTNATTFSARTATQSAMFYAPVVFLRISNDAANLTYGFSYDGINYTTLATTAINNFFTTAPDEIGLGGYCFVTRTASLTVVSWEIS